MILLLSLFVVSMLFPCAFAKATRGPQVWTCTDEQRTEQAGGRAAATEGVETGAGIGVIRNSTD